jgi:hypothetical protein
MDQDKNIPGWSEEKIFSKFDLHKAYKNEQEIQTKIQY